MEQKEIVDRAGVVGVVTQRGQERVVIRLENGRFVAVPTDMVQSENGKNVVAASFAELDEVEKREGETAVLQRVEEELSVGKRRVEKGKVRLTKQVVVEDEEISIPLTKERVEVERRPVGEIVEEAPPIRQEENRYVIPVLKEVLVVEKRLMLVEEIHVSRLEEEELYEETVRLRKEEVKIERITQDESR